MATSTAQRVGIWTIAVTLTVGTVLGFVVMIISSKNDTESQAALSKYQQQYSTFQTKVADAQTSIDKDTDKLSKQYYSTLNEQKSRVKTFNASDVKELKTTVIKGGTGEAITDDSAYAAYYIGFTPDGKIFDSSIDGKKLKAPFVVQPSGVIQGWTQGLRDKKIGGIYELTIPSALAYGETGSGENIKPNTPLKFIVFPIKFIATAPQLTQEVIDAYGQQQ